MHFLADGLNAAQRHRAVQRGDYQHCRLRHEGGEQDPGSGALAQQQLLSMVDCPSCPLDTGPYEA